MHKKKNYNSLYIFYAVLTSPFLTNLNKTYKNLIKIYPDYVSQDKYYKILFQQNFSNLKNKLKLDEKLEFFSIPCLNVYQRELNFIEKLIKIKNNETYICIEEANHLKHIFSQMIKFKNSNFI